MGIERIQKHFAAGLDGATLPFVAECVSPQSRLHHTKKAVHFGPELTVSLLKTEFLDKNLLWQQKYENYALESEGTSGQRRDVQRILKRASNFRPESCGQIATSNQWRRSLGLGVILQAARRS